MMHEKPIGSFDAMDRANDHVPLDLVWGAAAIGKIIGRTPKQVFHMLEKGHITPARKLGGQWVVSERLLRDFFEAG